jgi:pyruvate/2-oxoglutarate dehydrogenase complex dihydrolipoamide acyltransferase (E2) component
MRARLGGRFSMDEISPQMRSPRIKKRDTSMRFEYRTTPFTVNRRMAAASSAVSAEQATIHAITEVDVTVPRRIMREHKERTGESLSLTAYIVACLARAVAAHPLLNSFRKGRRLVLLEDVTVSVLVERDVEGEKVPEPLGIRAAQAKTCRDIHDEIRAAQRRVSEHVGDLTGIGWVRFIPGFLLRTFIRLASRSIVMGERYGKVAVTAVGMFGEGPTWFVPHGGATVCVTVGGIVQRPVPVDGGYQAREHLCLTVSFDHAIIDGAPAARFMRSFGELLRGGELLTGAGGIQ